jgi:hypothetical protein
MTKQDRVVKDQETQVKQIGKQVDKFPVQCRPMRGSLDNKSAVAGNALVQADSQKPMPKTSDTVLAAKGTRPWVFRRSGAGSLEYC